MKVHIDKTSSGFCFGVQETIDLAEKMLRNSSEPLYCLGDIVHNEVEVKRLEELGMITIGHDQYAQLDRKPVLIRAHGEPPATYDTAKQNNLHVTDSTCPVVARLQKTAQQLVEKGYQVIIYGKKAHPEVIGINGHCDGKALVIRHADLSDPEETATLNLNRKSALISQTTMDVPGFLQLKENLERLFGVPGWKACTQGELNGSQDLPDFIYRDTICRQVSNRNEQLALFASQNDVIVFVAGRKSSNGQVLFNVCRQSNPSTWFVEDETELQNEWFMKEGRPVESVGVCGATSTPMWLLENVGRAIEKRYAK